MTLQKILSKVPSPTTPDVIAFNLAKEWNRKLFKGTHTAGFTAIATAPASPGILIKMEKTPKFSSVKLWLWFVNQP